MARCHGFLLIFAAVIAFDGLAFTFTAVRAQIDGLISRFPGLDAQHARDEVKDSFAHLENSYSDYDDLPRRFNRELLLDFFSPLVLCCIFHFFPCNHSTTNSDSACLSSFGFQVRNPLRLPCVGRRSFRNFGQLGTYGTMKSLYPRASALGVLCCGRPYLV